MTGTGNWQPAGTPTLRELPALAEEEAVDMTDWHTERLAGQRLADPALVGAADRPDPPKFPDWVAETYGALAHIQNLRKTPPTTPRQLTDNEPTERKCRR